MNFRKEPSLTMEIIDKNTPGFLDRIGKKELGMLIEMLEDLDHSALERSRKSYGYLGNGQWNEAQLAHYKTGIPGINANGSPTMLPEGVIPLKERMEKQGYTFFILRNDKKEVVALASGNAYPDQSQLRVLNIAVDRPHRGQGYVGELIKRLSHHAAEHQFASMVMPLSEHALQKGNKVLYEKVAGILELGYAIAPHPNDPSSIEFRVSPKRFKTLDIESTAAAPGMNVNFY